MTDYQHGGDLYGRAHLLDFSENVNPLGLPENVKKRLAEALPTFAVYPDTQCRDLTAALARHLNIAPEWLLFGSGAADLIYRIMLALRPRAGLVLAPTFSEYAHALQMVDAQVVPHFLLLKETFQLTKRILEQITPELDIVILCTPNNPTGQLTARSLLLQIAEKCAALNITLLVDECFMPFVDDPAAFTLTHSLEAFPNIILLSAFTKIYAMAGLRLGYLLCTDAHLRERIAQYAPPWNISAPAQVAGIAALEDWDYLSRSRRLIKREREWLCTTLTAHGMTVYGSQADYLFFRCPDAAFAKRLEEHGILIRSCENFRGLEPGFFRIGIKTHEKNERLVAAIRAITEGADTWQKQL